MGKHGVLLFHTSSAAFAAEKALNRAGLDCELIPPPRELTSDCGVALQFEWKIADEVNRAVEAAGVEVAEVRRRA